MRAGPLPSDAMLAATALEVLVTPLLWSWQARIAGHLVVPILNSEPPVMVAAGPHYDPIVEIEEDAAGSRS